MVLLFCFPSCSYDPFTKYLAAHFVKVPGTVNHFCFYNDSHTDCLRLKSHSLGQCRPDYKTYSLPGLNIKYASDMNWNK